jgi:hypothetical protein
MNLRDWFASEAGYGRELMDSGLAGASNSRKEFLHGAPLASYFSDLERRALGLATVGLCVGVVASFLDRRRKPVVRALACGALGSVLGFAGSFAWSSHTLAQTVARGALRNMAAVRDQHWLKNHPIDYA